MTRVFARRLLLGASALQIGGAGLVQLAALGRGTFDLHIAAGAGALALGGLIALLVARALR
ncbi:hypothetical protein E5163_01385 [Marinicauda algicola]|uniref:Uncharacterized protein n=1 Tax=Marinicauda algicola TaxID=2029849 RepID=A0A4S2H395_9PROT|nr:hypothetical protein [Marinicauda algicola]TGY89821.1 hypothetical protein E5163_01385 [Marinicauda algicola]